MGEITKKYKIYLDAFNESRPKKIHANVKNIVLDKFPHGQTKLVFNRDSNTSKYSLNYFFAQKLDTTVDKLGINLGDHLYKQIALFRSEPLEDVFKVPKGLLDCFGDSLVVQEYSDKREYGIEGSFWMLHYEYHDGVIPTGTFIDIRQPEIGIDLIRIDKDLSSKIYPIRSQTSYNYSSEPQRLGNSGENTIELKFRALGTEIQKPLVLSFYVNPHIEITTGQYTSKDSTSHLIRGSVILIRLTKDQENKINEYEPKDFKDQKFQENLDDDLKGLITEEVEFFFRNKHQNYSKTPANIFKYGQFSRWLRHQKAIIVGHERDHLIARNTLFISCPRQFLGEKLDSYRGPIQKFIKFNENFLSGEIDKDITCHPDFKAFNNIHSIFNTDDYEHKKSKPPQFLNTNLLLKESSYHIAIVPKGVTPCAICVLSH